MKQNWLFDIKSFFGRISFCVKKNVIYQIIFCFLRSCVYEFEVEKGTGLWVMGAEPGCGSFEPANRDFTDIDLNMVLKQIKNYLFTLI